ncbi:MAG: hypothetical protein LBD57_06520 [Endomicrobium sp.]|jgi:hypothetical protein|uniref:hypothetical protein n=1 Tax=Candidatus Endomicrobiellum cubanum TaxID=3242325 RepID=UPI0028328436|nr:hypothetical protein [Endomicrobium sp.]
MLRVVTLPITPADGNGEFDRSFVTLFTPFVADIVAKDLMVKPTIMLNIVGMKSDVSGKSSESQMREYLGCLNRLGIAADAFNDAHDDYESYFGNLVTKLLKERKIISEAKQMVWCKCGRIEMPVEVANSILYTARHKTLLTGEDLASAVCKKCGSKLETSVDEVQLFRLQPARINVFPPIYREELQAIIKRLTDNGLIISRLHRAAHCCFDIDFRWSGFVNYIAKSNDEVVIVSSPTTLNQAARVILFTKMIEPSINIRLIVHPLLRVQDGGVVLSKMSISEFFYGIRNSLRSAYAVSNRSTMGFVRKHHSF